MSQTSPVRTESFSYEVIYFTQINLHSFDCFWPCEWKCPFNLRGLCSYPWFNLTCYHPPRATPGTNSALWPGGEELFEAVAVPGVREWGESKVTSLLIFRELCFFCKKKKSIRIRIVRTFVCKFKTNLQIQTLILIGYSSPFTLRQIPAFSFENT